MANKVLVAFDSFFQNAKELERSLSTAARAADHEVQITCVDTAQELVNRLRNAIDDTHLILSQTFDHRRFEREALEGLRRACPHGNVRIILIINRPREEVSDEELTSLLRAGFYDLYFLSDVESARKLITTSWTIRSAEEAYRYLRLMPPSEVRPITKIPKKENLEGIERDKKKARYGKNYFFEAPIARSRVPVGRRRVVAVCSCSGQIGASGLAINLALAVAASGRKVAFQELPPERGYHVAKMLSREIIKPIQHAATLYQTGRAQSGENLYHGVTWYYEQPDGISISQDRIDGAFLVNYLTLPAEDVPTILDVGSSFFRLIDSDEATEMITDVVVAVRSDRLTGDAVPRMERLLSVIQGIGIRPLIVCLNEDPPKKASLLWKEYGALLYYINPERSDEYGIYNGGEEELSGVIHALGLFDARVPDAPLPSAPVQMEIVGYQPPQEDIDFEEIVPQEKKTFLPLFGKPVGKERTPFKKSEENPHIIENNLIYGGAGNGKTYGGVEEVREDDAPAPAEDNSAPVENGTTPNDAFFSDREEMQKRISELATANNDLIANLNKANENIELQNTYIREQCVSLSDYQALRTSYEELQQKQEVLLQAQEAAGRDRTTLTTAASTAEQESERRAEEIARLNQQIIGLNTAIGERDNEIASLKGTIKGKDETIETLSAGSTAAAKALEDMTADRNLHRDRALSFEQEVGRLQSNLESKAGELDSVRNDNEVLRNTVSDLQTAAAESSEAFESKLAERIREITETASGDRQQLLEQLQAAQQDRREFETQKEQLIAKAKEEADAIRRNAEADASAKRAEAQNGINEEYGKILARRQELEHLDASVKEKLSQAAVDAQKIISDATISAEKKKEEALAYYANKAQETRRAEEEASQQLEETRARLAAEEERLRGREEEIEARENDLKLQQGVIDKQKRQAEQDRSVIDADLRDLEEKKKDFAKRVRELSAQEEDVKDREAKRAEKERRAIAKAEERADLHRLKMEERRKGGSSGTTFFICLLILVLVFGGMLYLVFKRGTDEVTKLRNEIAETEASMLTVLVAKDDLVEGQIVTMSDFLVTTIRTAEGDTSNADKYITSFSGTLVLKNGLSKGQCLTVGDFTSDADAQEGGGT